jgi:hypothetical protein
MVLLVMLRCRNRSSLFAAVPRIFDGTLSSSLRFAASLIASNGVRGILSFALLAHLASIFVPLRYIGMGVAY